jgi:hypothetical protein
MQPEEQPISDVINSTKTDLRGVWPPKLLRLVVGAVCAAVLGFVVLKTMYPIFVVPMEIARVLENDPVWKYDRLDKAQFAVDSKNYSIVFGVIAAVFAASGSLCSFGARSITALLIAVVGAAAMGVLGANLSHGVFHYMSKHSGEDMLLMGFTLDSMKQSILGYSLLWGLIGAGVGVGIGSVCGMGKSLVAGISGLCGGVLAALLYVLLTAQFFLDIKMNRVLPYNGADQAILLGVFTLVIAVCIALGCGERRPKTAA